MELTACCTIFAVLFLSAGGLKRASTRHLTTHWTGADCSSYIRVIRLFPVLHATLPTLLPFPIPFLTSLGGSELLNRLHSGYLVVRFKFVQVLLNLLHPTDQVVVIALQVDAGALVLHLCVDADSSRLYVGLVSRAFILRVWPGLMVPHNSFHFVVVVALIARGDAIPARVGVRASLQRSAQLFDRATWLLRRVFIVCDFVHPAGDEIHEVDAKAADDDRADNADGDDDQNRPQLLVVVAIVLQYQSEIRVVKEAR